MYLSRIELLPDAANNPTFWSEVTSLEGAHQAVWRIFRRSTEQKRDFLFRQETGGGLGQGRLRFFVLSNEPPLNDAARLWRIDEPKIFAPKLREGDRLRFILRASPTVKRKSADNAKQGKRCDVLMDARQRHLSGDRPFDPLLTMQLEGERWLSRQSINAGFEIVRSPVEMVGNDGLVETIERSALRVDGYRQHQLRRKSEAPIRFSSMEFEGVLVVSNPIRFLEKLKLGFGPQKAFGCGLMLLQRDS